MRHLTLTEYQPLALPAEALSTAEGTLLWQIYGSQIAVEFPSPKTNFQWVLTAQGWVGHIPLTADCQLHLQPRVPLRNLCQMLLYAYRLRSFQWLMGTVQLEVDSVADFWAQLAQLLADGVLARVRRGVQKAYRPEVGWPAAVRGRLDTPRMAATPWATTLPCTYSHHTADTPHNQLLAVTLRLLAQSGLCPPEVQTAVRRAYHALPPLTERPWTAEQAAELSYDRLTADYRPLHALCRLFLANSLPSHQRGQEPLRPFLVNMAQLFEQFVAEWLANHLPAGYRVRVQHRLAAGPFTITPDLVLEDEVGRPLAVLDTKYKTPLQPAPEDVYQVAFYASNGLGCGRAVLVYPQPLARPLNQQYEQVLVETLPFDVRGDLAQAGQAFVSALVGERMGTMLFSTGDAT